MNGAAAFTAYADPALPLADAVMNEITDFISQSQERH
jgi:hypothetical protein